MRKLAPPRWRQSRRGIAILVALTVVAASLVTQATAMSKAAAATVGVGVRVR